MLYEVITSIVINLDNGEVHSTYHAAAVKDDKVTVDYQIASQAEINQERITFEAKLHSLDYTFEINKTTLGITRYIDKSNDDVITSYSIHYTKLYDNNVPSTKAFMVISLLE